MNVQPIEIDINDLAEILEIEVRPDAPGARRAAERLLNHLERLAENIRTAQQYIQETGRAEPNEEDQAWLAERKSEGIQMLREIRAAALDLIAAGGGGALMELDPTALGIVLSVLLKQIILPWS